MRGLKPPGWSTNAPQLRNAIREWSITHPAEAKELATILVELKDTSDDLAQVDTRVGQVDPARRILVEVGRWLRGMVTVAKDDDPGQQE